MSATIRSLMIAAVCFACPVLFSASNAEARGGEFCVPLVGTFESATLPPDQCDSPVGLCTAGELTGSLRGSYGYVAATLTSANDPTIPFVHFYTGESTVQTRFGATLIGTDSGTLDLDPNGFGFFTALITFTSITGRLEGSRSQISLQGRLDLATGQASGSYQGKLCRTR